MLRTYKTCNLTRRFSKYEFKNRLLNGVTLFKIYILDGVIYIYIYGLTHLTHLEINSYSFRAMWGWADCASCYAAIDKSISIIEVQIS